MALVKVGGIVSVDLSPPMGFIEAQTGRFRQALQDFSGLWVRFAKTMAAIEVERFATAGHGEWPPLAPATLIEKERLGFPPDPLIRTGDLVESLTDAARAARMDPQSMSWGTDVPYAQYHQEGGTITRRTTRTVNVGPGVGQRAGARGVVTDESVWHLPQRKVLDIRVDDRRRLETDMVGWLNDVAREAFGSAAV